MTARNGFEIRYGVLKGYCGNETNVIIPDGVKLIELGGNWHCPFIKSITIPKSVTSIMEGVFEHFTSLERIEVDPQNQYYKSVNGTLYSKDGKTLVLYAPVKKESSFEIPQGVTTIGAKAFYRATSLKSVTIPDSVDSIGYSAFSGCSSLTGVTIPNSVKSIGTYAFASCPLLGKIIIPKSVVEMGDDVFYGYHKLAICCEATEKPIKWHSRWNPNNRPVKWGYKPAKQKKKGEDEKKDKEVGNEKPSPIENFKITSNGALTKYLGAEEIITIPEGVKSISTFAFTENYKLRGIVKQIILPKSLEIIEDGAFADLELMEKIIIPKGVGVIGRVAFRGCKSLTIYCEISTPPSAWDTRKYSLWSAERPVVWGYKSK